MDLRVTREDSATADFDHLHLTSIVVVVMLTLFITLLAVFTGNLDVLWPLYLAPILIAALTHGVPGAILTTTLSAGIVVLILPGTDHSTASRLGMVVGLVTFLGGGAVVGIAASRYRRRVRALERASVHDSETGLLKSTA
ncbi:MAG: hypothetical protein Q7V14_05705, partial [Coriobacteriia bacterium]|nr:hypothetical protein [Coriobacteriia bacterium]